MLYVFGCWDPARASLFQTGWFVESLITQTLIIHVIRTNKIPFIQSRASWQLTMTTVVDHGRRRRGCPIRRLPRRSASPHCRRFIGRSCSLTLLCYVVLTQAVKMWLIRKNWL